MFWRRWMCNLGYHRLHGRSMSGKTITYPFVSGSQTLSYIECQSCGSLVSGNVVVNVPQHWPSYEYVEKPEEITTLYHAYFSSGKR